MSTPNDLSSLQNDLDGRVNLRNQEQERVVAFRKRLEQLRTDATTSVSTDAVKADALLKKCEMALSSAEKVADSLIRSIEEEKHELERVSQLLKEAQQQQQHLRTAQNSSNSLQVDNERLMNLLRAKDEELNSHTLSLRREVDTLKSKLQLVSDERSLRVPPGKTEAAFDAEVLAAFDSMLRSKSIDIQVTLVDDPATAKAKQLLTNEPVRVLLERLIGLNEEKSILESRIKASNSTTSPTAAGPSAAVKSDFRGTTPVKVSAPVVGVAAPSVDSSDARQRTSLLARSRPQSTSLGGNQFVGAQPQAISSPPPIVENEGEQIRRERDQHRKDLNQMIGKLRSLESKFASEEALCMALYANLSAENFPSPQRVGFLTKQGGQVKSWKRRFFILKDNFLFYFKKPKDDKPVGIIHLVDYSVEEGDGDESGVGTNASGSAQKRNCFRILTKPRVWVLQADQQGDMDIWVFLIKHANPWYAMAETSSQREANKRKLVRLSSYSK